ncbi:primase-helicase family protein [Desulfovibrio oxyclinae]|uniref:primase-helicase family protein n=1 Tax=Desulfovibrio oxyclinae TaxID=63560 RepID=UPI000380A236|nr:primase-helicase family protein [Desulfovibrio oxyclinae]
MKSHNGLTYRKEDISSKNKPLLPTLPTSRLAEENASLVATTISSGPGNLGPVSDEAIEFVQNVIDDGLTHPNDIIKLVQMNHEFFVARHNGKVSVLQETTNENGQTEIVALTDRELMLLKSHETIRQIKSYDKNHQPQYKNVRIADAWLTWKFRRTYEATVFRPGGLNEDDAKRFYNLFQGFEVTPAAGQFPRIEYHLKEVWCRGNWRHYRFLTNWWAHLLQYPNEKAKVALVIKGGKGAGKSTIFEGIFERILGAAYCKVDRPEQVTGKFNAHQRGKLLLVLEEAVWAGDKAAEGALKSMITDRKTMIEPKCVDAYQEDSYFRLAFVSNERRAVPATADERRYFALSVSSDKAMNIDYFRALWEEIENGGVEAFMHHLINWKVDRTELFNPPLTEALFEDIYESFSAFEKWVYELLHDEDAIDWGKPVRTKDLFDHYKAWYEEARGLGSYLKGGQITSQGKMKSMAEAFFSAPHRKIGGQSHLEMPTMKNARKIFESKVKAVVMWRDEMSNERIPGNRLAPSASQVHDKDAVDWFFEDEMSPEPSEHFNIRSNDPFFQDEIAAACTDD